MSYYPYYPNPTPNPNPNPNPYPLDPYTNPNNPNNPNPNQGPLVYPDNYQHSSGSYLGYNPSTYIYPPTYPITNFGQPSYGVTSPDYNPQLYPSPFPYTASSPIPIPTSNQPLPYSNYSHPTSQLVDLNPPSMDKPQHNSNPNTDANANANANAGAVVHPNGAVPHPNDNPNPNPPALYDSYEQEEEPRDMECEVSHEVQLKTAPTLNPLISSKIETKKIALEVELESLLETPLSSQFSTSSLKSLKQNVDDSSLEIKKLETQLKDLDQQILQLYQKKQATRMKDSAFNVMVSELVVYMKQAINQAFLRYTQAHPSETRELESFFLEVKRELAFSWMRDVKNYHDEDKQNAKLAVSELLTSSMVEFQQRGNGDKLNIHSHIQFPSLSPETMNLYK
eukprot:TRINITY_DN10063_c0_g1_i3.p1 TRINITY_DN10063_c0_g1~~TRINITY_DN10063_c0_g1_i3.p1  ORF type:complete len:395 (+),score=70.24 TRINITY_DN10063_c0_g1_i3:1-1185(+)